MLIAHIREAECIGCSRCIPACPVDAILGTNKFLHSVLTDECIGCRLCIDPCPVDCIEMVESSSSIDKPTLAAKAKQRYIARQQRLQQEAQRQLPVYVDQDQQRVAIRQEISAAVARAAIKNHHE